MVPLYTENLQIHAEKGQQDHSKIFCFLKDNKKFIDLEPNMHIQNMEKKNYPSACD